MLDGAALAGLAGLAPVLAEHAASGATAATDSRSIVTDFETSTAYPLNTRSLNVHLTDEFRLISFENASTHTISGNAAKREPGSHRAIGGSAILARGDLAFL